MQENHRESNHQLLCEPRSSPSCMRAQRREAEPCRSREGLPGRVPWERPSMFCRQNLGGDVGSAGQQVPQGHARGRVCSRAGLGRCFGWRCTQSMGGSGDTRPHQPAGDWDNPRQIHK